MTTLALVLLLVCSVLGFLLGGVLAALVTFRATPWLIGRLTDAERAAFARKVRTVANRRRDTNQGAP